MASGLNGTYFVFDRKADELYAADAGIREAIWRIRNQETYPLVLSGNITTSVNEVPLNENGKGYYRTNLFGQYR